MRGQRVSQAVAMMAVALVLSACGTQGTEGTSVDLGASLQADVEVGAPFDTQAYRPNSQGVRVEYTLTNDGDRPLLVVLERGHEQGGFQSGPYVPDAVWVSGGGEGVARLSKQMFDVPRDSLPTDPWTAPAQIVPPGENLSGRMFVGLPIQERLPQSDLFLSHDETPLNGQLDQVEICVQVAPVSEQFPNATRMTGITDSRTLVCAGPLPVPSSPTSPAPEETEARHGTWRLQPDR